MAYLILEDDNSGNESACFEFNPENEASLSTMEALLKARRTMNSSPVEQLGEIAAESMDVTCKRESVPGWLRKSGVFRSNRVNKSCARKDVTCRCRCSQKTAGVQHDITRNNLSPA